MKIGSPRPIVKRKIVEAPAQVPTNPNSSYSSVSRKDVAREVSASIHRYFVPKVFSVYDEVGVCKRGSRRADIVAVNMKRFVVICEIKSSWQDFATDHKWPQYLDYCNQMYFALPDTLWESHGDKIREAITGSGAGIMCSTLGGTVRVVLPAARRKFKCIQNRMWLFTKLAWLGGHSRAKRKH